MGKNIIYCGAQGNGQRVKAVNQVICALHILACSEGMLFAKQLGLDLQTVHDVVSSGAAGSWMLSNLGPKLIAGDFASRETVELIRQQLGLDRPLPVQYARYLGSLVRGDLGVSIRTGIPVATELLRYFPASLELAFVAMLLSGTLGVLFGVLAAAFRDRWPDHGLRLLALTGISTPSFWLAFVLIYVFFGLLGWFPAGGRIDPQLADFPRVTGLYTVDALLALRPRAFASAVHHLALPATALSIINLGTFSRLIRASLLEELGRDYVLTARASGLCSRSCTKLRSILSSSAGSLRR